MCHITQFTHNNYQYTNRASHGRILVTTNKKLSKSKISKAKYLKVEMIDGGKGT